jgi:hypothetical protein
MNKIEFFICSSCHYHSCVGAAAYGLVLTINGERVFTKAEGFKNIPYVTKIYRSRDGESNNFFKQIKQTNQILWNF